MAKQKNAFTLIEVLVSVVIISTVIMALLTMNGNTKHLFSSFKNQTDINQYGSFFISNETYGFSKDEGVTLDKLLNDFNVDEELRKKLKNEKVDILYTISDKIDMGEFEDDKESENYDKEKEVNSNLIIEIGKTTIKTKISSISLVRIKVEK